ncbi:hypothetical protein [Stenotrophomonas sp. CC22-02]|uniref:hypothetical protein n=1 Tax=Stenotrophomonas sp. CC22-02 TaxID=1378087 RepID=UPI001063AD4A|nr:hypothetical protein [Stenotrophomonas sp. CC22-02]MBN5172971.1 hypothetical protein [Stenotrophomonas maltophilia]HEL3779643.1 hypothetical protein [Stenotrophomonas maltophilia]HEL5005445.1 hypothetical protein [Stenotrophomonas maltophilia]
MARRYRTLPHQGMAMEFRVLPAGAPERQQLARWYHAQWGRDAGLSLEQELQRLNPAQDADGFPQMPLHQADNRKYRVLVMVRRLSS